MIENFLVPYGLAGQGWYDDSYGDSVYLSYLSPN